MLRCHLFAVVFLTVSTIYSLSFGESSPDTHPSVVAASSIPDISKYEKADKLGNIFFWVGQTKILALAVGNESWALFPFMALYGLQEAGLGLNFYANQGYYGAYRGMGGETSFMRTTARNLYLVNKAITLASIGLSTFGGLTDNDGLAIAGLVGFGIGDLFNFYTWHQLRQSNSEAKSAVRNWNAVIGLKNRGLNMKLVFAF